MIVHYLRVSYTLEGLMDILPRHMMPLPVLPSLHSHVNPPSVSVQSANS